MDIKAKNHTPEEFKLSLERELMLKDKENCRYYTVAAAYCIIFLCSDRASADCLRLEWKEEQNF